MSAEPELSEPDFVGEGRRGLVAGLLALFDRASQDQRAVWVSLEAPTGWGKTRVAREFYAELARSRQSSPEYWPQAMVSWRSNVSARRKTVNPPDFDHVAMSRPDYLWWGIACGLRNGTPSESLLADIGALRKHIDHLENAWWYRAGFVEKFAFPAFLAVRAKVMEEGTSAIADFGLAKAAELVGSALPGFSVMSWLARKGIQQGRAARARTRVLRSAEQIAYQPTEADEVESFLAKIAPLVPVVICVEDVHDADDLLLDLLGRLVRRDAPVMIVTTGWPGYLDTNRGLARAMRIAGERLVRIDEEAEHLPPPFPAGATLRALETEDLLSIVHAHHDRVGRDTEAALMTRFRNPFALELVLEALGRGEGDLSDIDITDLDELSGKVEDLHRQAWERLDEHERDRLALMTLGIPAIVTGKKTDGRSWDREAVEASIARSTHAPIGESWENGPERAWIRPIDPYFSQFNDVAQMNLAAREFVPGTRRRSVRDALIQEAKRLLADDATPADRLAQASRLLLAYGADLDERDLVSACRALVDVLSDLPGESGAIAEVADEAHSHLDLGDPRDRDLLWSAAQAQGTLGHAGRSIELLEQLLGAEGGIYGPDAPELLGTRRSIATAMISDGQAGAAVVLLESLLAQQLRSMPEDVAEVLNTRAGLALALAAAGRPADSIRLDEESLTMQAETSGPDSAEVTSTRQRLATTLTDTGRAVEALPMWQQVVADLTAQSGADSRRTLAARSRSARAIESAEGPMVAAEFYTTLLADERRVLGTDHADVLTTRRSLAHASSESGAGAAADAIYLTLAEDEKRIGHSGSEFD